MKDPAGRTRVDLQIAGPWDLRDPTVNSIWCQGKTTHPGQGPCTQPRAGPTAACAVTGKQTRSQLSPSDHS